MANDKELEQQNRTLKELVDNQKETNKTLVTGFSALQKSGTEDSTFMSKNLGSLMEVAATMKAQKKSEQFDKKEQVTEVDEKVEKLTEENVKEGKKSRNLLRTIAEVSTKSYDKVGVAASKATEMAREGSQKLRKLGDTIVKGVTKGFRETWGTMTKVAKRLTFGGILFAAFMIAFMNFLDSDFFNKGFGILRNTIIPAIGKVWEILKSIGGHLKTFFGPLYNDIMNYLVGSGAGPGGKKGLGQIFSDNLFASLVALGGLALLLAPKKLLLGLLVGSTWGVVGVLTKAFAGIAGVISALAMQIVNIGARALGMAPIGSAARAAAEAAKVQRKPSAGKQLKLQGQKFTFQGQQWTTESGAVATKEQSAGLQKKLQKGFTLKSFGKFGSRGMQFLKAARGLGPLGTAIILGMSGLDAYRIMTTLKGEQQKDALAQLLFGTLGTVGMIAIGAGVGAAFGGPLGGIAGAVLGGMSGEYIGGVLADWLLHGKVKDAEDFLSKGGSMGISPQGMGGVIGSSFQTAGQAKPPKKDGQILDQTRIRSLADVATGVGTGQITKVVSRQVTSEERPNVLGDILMTNLTNYSKNLAINDAKRENVIVKKLEEVKEAIVEQSIRTKPPTIYAPNNSITKTDTTINGVGTKNSNGPIQSALEANWHLTSDIRLKEDIELIDKSPSGINIYSFKYIDEEEKYQGVMAQEVLWASTPDEKGYYSVDYSKLDVDFKKLN